jgi:glycosyltransferase involved in cell wall biosynthesis
MLEALDRQEEVPGGFEAVVVDDGGGLEDALVESDLTARVRARFLRQANTGPGVARNHGVREARGRFLAFTDDDCEPDPAWARSLVARLEASPDVAFGGRIVEARRDSPYAIANAVVLDHVEAHLNSPEPRFYRTMNLALARERFLETGGFDPFFHVGGEDREFCLRWFERGLRLRPAPEAIVVHDRPLDLRGFWRQHLNYGRGACRLRQRRSGDEARLERGSFYRDLLVAGARAGRGPGQLAVAALVVLSQLATTVGFLLEMRKRRVAPGSC